MSSTSTTTRRLNSEIITILNGNNAAWGKICGPNGSGMTFEDLLSALDAGYPLTGWTSELLASTLAGGLSSGLYKMYPNGVYYLYTNMVQVNPINSYYQQFSSLICGLPTAPRMLT